MCGIVGGVNVDAGEARVAELHELIRHRGPDDRGEAVISGVLLVHERLSIIDLRACARQPMTSADGTLTITYNGEIYNYKELRAELEGRYPFRTTSDTEVILAAYQLWGDGFLSRLRGMFAFGLWDDRRKRLLCATDRLSIKPLLYAQQGERFAFASEAKPIGALLDGLRPNRRMLYQYLQHGMLDHTDETLFEGISQLRPGTYLTVERGRVDVTRYWDLRDEGEDAWRGDASIDEIDALLCEAVDLHLRGDVEPALSLSSGLDSNVLRAVIQRDGAYGGLQCFTYCFTGTPYDECRRVAPIVSGADIRHAATDVRSDDLIDGLETLVRYMESPPGGLGIYGYWRNSQTVHARGLKVLLDGQGSDEGFAGYKYYLDAFQGRAGGSGIKAPDGTALTSDYLTREFTAACGAPPPEMPAPFRDPVKNLMYRDLFFLKIPKLLRFQDRAAMAWGVEVRVPFLDHVLLERLYRTPTSVLLDGGVTKSILRRIAARRLPVQTDETKLYVSAPQREWIKGPLAPAIEQLLGESQLGADGYIDTARLRHQYEAYRRDPELGNSFFVWKFLTLELWYRALIRPAARRMAASRA